MIKIITIDEFAQSTKYSVGFDGSDFPIEKLEYLMKEHSGKTFVLDRGMLVEVVELW